MIEPKSIIDNISFPTPHVSLLPIALNIPITAFAFYRLLPGNSLCLIHFLNSEAKEWTAASDNLCGDYSACGWTIHWTFVHNASKSEKENANDTFYVVVW